MKKVAGLLLAENHEEAIKALFQKGPLKQKHRQTLERFAMAEGLNWDEEGYSHLAP